MFFINNFYCSLRIRDENQDICKETQKPCHYQNCNHTREAVENYLLKGIKYDNNFEEVKIEEQKI